jgi:hypothetical protein
MRTRELKPRHPGLCAQEALGPAPCTARSQCRLLASLPGRRSTPSTSTLMAPSGASLASGSTRVGTTYKWPAPLPSCTRVASGSCTRGIGTSCTYGICTTSAYCVDFPGTGDSWCNTIGHKELRGTVVRSPVLIADGTNRDGCGGVTRCATNQQTIGVADVRLLAPRNHFFSSATKIGET